jgi:hypothetical protein
MGIEIDSAGASLGARQWVGFSRGVVAIDTGAIWGPFWDHTSCAMVNDLRVCKRYTLQSRLPQVL